MWYEPQGEFTFKTVDGEFVSTNTLTHELPAPGVTFSSCYRPTRCPLDLAYEALPALTAAIQYFCFGNVWGYER